VYTYVGDRWVGVLEDAHIYFHHRPVDEFRTEFEDVRQDLKEIFLSGDYLQIYGWLQHVLRLEPSQSFADDLDQLLQACRSPYRVVGDDVLVPVGSDSDVRTIETAFDNLNANGLLGAREHLKSASSELSAGKFADSVRESIRAVESVVRVLEPHGDFSKALVKLEAKTSIHGALKKGFLAIYGFTSDEQGIRHALLDKDAADVDEADALFMIGACSAFVSYLINKARLAGLLK
jgi:hypothetical protein